MKEISLIEFERLLNPLIKYHAEMDVIDDCLAKIFPDTKPFTELGLNVETAYLELIDKYLDDIYCEEWISYFMYDCCFGANPLEVQYTNSDGKKVKRKMKDIKTLYKVIYNK